MTGQHFQLKKKKKIAIQIFFAMHQIFAHMIASNPRIVPMVLEITACIWKVMGESFVKFQFSIQGWIWCSYKKTNKKGFFIGVSGVCDVTT